MTILHYSLGLPPYRSGGLTKYCTDLMMNEAENNKVILLYPGRVRIFSNKAKIKANRKYGRISVYEIVNPLPVPLLYGIRDIERYIEKKDENIFIQFLKQQKIECIHIHTFMGLPIEFLKAARRLKIRVVYTTHDYFGLCPKASLYDLNNKICDGYCAECEACSTNAISYRKNIILQSHLYRKIKNTSVIRKLRNKTKVQMNITKKVSIVTSTDNDYERLKKYYYLMFEFVDVFHFNSTTTYDVFKKHLNIKSYKIIPITHNDIKDERKKRFSPCEKIQVGYLGGPTVEKGFYKLIEIMDNDLNNKFELSIFFKPAITRKYLKIREKYDYNHMEKALKEIDIIIVPSLWKETFGFVVLEALSFGIPVIVSDNVGAKDIVTNGENGYIYESSVELRKIMKDIKKEDINKMNLNILEEDSKLFDARKHTQEILKLYQGEDYD